MLKWFIAPNGEKLLVTDVLEKGLLKDHYPTSYLSVCAEERQWTGKPSTTQLINGTRYEYLRILTPYAIDPSESAFRIIGTRGHAILEKFAPLKSHAEMDVSDDEISGIADLVEPGENGCYNLTDYKTWGSYKVGLALGIVKKKQPAIDSEGNPILYQRSGPGYQKGDQKMEDVYTIDPDKIDMYESELQLNRYRIVIESVYGVKIDKLRIFAIVRDGNTIAATGRGINKNTYYLNVRRMEDDFIKIYFSGKRLLLIAAIDNFKTEMSKKYINLKDNFLLYNDAQIEENYKTLKENCPPLCDEKESWSGHRCDVYCPISEICKRIGK